MLSPKTVNTTVTVLAEFNYKRKEIVLQNTGSKDVYIKKVILNSAVPIPSSTNYDYILLAPSGEDNKFDSVLAIESVAGFVAVVASGTGSVAVMETVYL